MDVNIGDLGFGTLWSTPLTYEFTETFAPRCSGYHPTVDPYLRNYWDESPDEMDEGYVLNAFAGELIAFRVVARDKYVASPRA